MDLGSIREEFNRYAERMLEIRKLSSPDIKKFDSADEYSKRLRHNFEKIGRLAAVNREMLDKDLYPLLNSTDSLNDELAGELEELADMLLNVAGDEDDFENLDLPIATLIADRLLRDVSESDDISERIRKMDEQIIVCYSMMNMTERITSYPELSKTYKDKGVEIGLKMHEFLKKDMFLTIPDMESREIVLTDARFMTALFERTSGDEEINDLNIRILDWMLEIADDEFYHEAVPDFDWNYFKFRTLEYFVQGTDILNSRGFTKEQLKKIGKRAVDLEKLCSSDIEYYSKIIGYDFYPISVARCKYLASKMSKKDYKAFLIYQYEKRDRMDFGTEGGYFNILLPLELICILDPENLCAADLELLRNIYRGLSAYLFRLPSNGMMSFVLEYFFEITRRFIDVPGGVSFEEFVLQSIAAIHPPTYVHSCMVGEITERLAFHAVRIMPELFIGMPGIKTVDDVYKNRGAITDYAYNAALCHDFGKISIIDTIFVYGRKLLDEEFQLIKSHPGTGYELLKAHSSSQSYAEVALGHHKWHDDSRGYPEDFKTSESVYKTVIDLVLCADCLDAATDTVGRSYNTGKTLKDYMEELKEGSGTRYAAWLFELLCHKEVFDDVEYLLNEGRRRNYQDTYSLLRGVQEKG